MEDDKHAEEKLSHIARNQILALYLEFLGVDDGKS